MTRRRRFAPRPGTASERVMQAADAAEDADAPVTVAEIARRAGAPMSTARGALLRWRPDSQGVRWAYLQRGPRPGTAALRVVELFDAEPGTWYAIHQRTGIARRTVRSALRRWRWLQVQALRAGVGGGAGPAREAA